MTSEYEHFGVTSAPHPDTVLATLTPPDPPQAVPPEEPPKYHWPPNHDHRAHECCECGGVVVLDYVCRRGQIYCNGCATVES